MHFDLQCPLSALRSMKCHIRDIINISMYKNINDFKPFTHCYIYMTIL